MKKLSTLLFVMAMLFCLKSTTAQAQQQLTFIYAGDSSWYYNCSAPDTVELNIYGYATGYGPNDSLHVEVDFGDGTDTTYMLAIVQNQYFFDDFHHAYALPGAYSAQFIVTDPNGLSDTLVDNSILVAAQCGDISGRVYLDLNGDCIYNTGETSIRTYVVATYNGNFFTCAYTDSAGNYFLHVPAGVSYVISLPYLNNLNVSCPNSGTYIVSTLPSTGIDFGIACNSQYDLTGSIWGQGFRVNANTSVWLDAWNKLITCAAPTATVTITLDPMLTYVSSSVAPVSMSSSQVVFNPGQLNGNNFSQFASSLTLLTNSAAMIGDTLCLTMTVDPTASDVNPADNTATICMAVRNSCDPNEMIEKHAGATTATVAPGTELEYTIMFQNVGNDDAFEVNVVDELDPSLDLSTLHITGFSHQNSLYILNNTLKFQFDNINLAAASVNESQSHGFVSFKIKPKTNVALGTNIYNSAKIYFDFNAAIVTNTVDDIINSTVGINTISKNNSLVISPNPAHDFFTVATGTTTLSELKIFDVTGKNLITKMDVVDQQKVSTKNLSVGMYFVTLISKGITYSGKLVVN